MEQIFEVQGSYVHVADEITTYIHPKDIQALVGVSKTFRSYFQDPKSWIRRWKYYGMKREVSQKWASFLNEKFLQASFVNEFLPKIFLKFEMKEKFPYQIYPYKSNFDTADPATLFIKEVMYYDPKIIPWEILKSMFHFLTFKDLNERFELQILKCSRINWDDPDEDRTVIINYYIQCKREKILFKAPCEVSETNMHEKGFLALCAKLKSQDRRDHYPRMTYAQVNSLK